MPSSNGGPYLAQGIDKECKLYEHTADGYAHYLRGAYKRNSEALPAEWDSHFAQTRTELRRGIARVLPNVPLDEMNMAIVGPGLKPIGRDFGLTEEKVYLPEMNSLVVADFSPEVVDVAINDIRSVTQEHTRLYPMQIDLTEGLSTAWAMLIERELTDIKTEDQLIEVAKNLDEMGAQKLRSELGRIIGTLVYDRVGSPNDLVLPEPFRGCGINEDHSYKLSLTNGERLYVHLWYLPMVIAGTGAAAEALIWETYANVVFASDNDLGPPKDGDERDEARKDMVKRFYKVIARFNNMAAEKSISNILADNPESMVLAVSDVTTTLKKPKKMGALYRLNVPELAAALDDDGINLEQVGGDTNWTWKDEPGEPGQDEGHQHGVNSFIATRKPSKNGGAVNIPILTDADIETVPDTSDEHKQDDVDAANDELHEDADAQQQDPPMEVEKRDGDEETESE